MEEEVVFRNQFYGISLEKDDESIMIHCISSRCETYVHMSHEEAEALIEALQKYLYECNQ